MKRILELSVSLIVACAPFTGTALQAQTASSTSSGVYTSDQAKRGDAVYQKTCVSCHSDDLEGNGQSPPLSGNDFLANWQGQPLGALFDKIQMTMPGDKPGSLMRAQTADVLAYILSANKFPAGSAELPTDADALKHISIEKPPAAAAPAPATAPAPAPGGSPGP